jgi:hypothetical protein
MERNERRGKGVTEESKNLNVFLRPRGWDSLMFFLSFWVFLFAKRRKCLVYLEDEIE